MVPLPSPNPAFHSLDDTGSIINQGSGSMDIWDSISNTFSGIGKAATSLFDNLGGVAQAANRANAVANPPLAQPNYMPVLLVGGAVLIAVIALK